MYTLESLRADLSSRVSLTTDPTEVAGWQHSAVREMVDAAFWRVVDYVYSDLAVDGLTQRWYLYGDDVALLPPERQIAPDGHATPPFYLAYTDVDWRQRAPDDVIIEPSLNTTGIAPSAPVGFAAGGVEVLPLLAGQDPDTGVAAIYANTLPAPVRNAAGVAQTTKVRVWYQRRCPQPDYTDPTSPIRVPAQFARIASLGYYMGILADNQPGGDLRQWRKQSEVYLQQAQLIYAQAVPVVVNAHKQSDQWLITGVPG